MLFPEWLSLAAVDIEACLPHAEVAFVGNIRHYLCSILLAE